MDLRDVLKNITDWAEKWPSSKTDEMSKIAKLAISEGWYFNEVFLFAFDRDYQEGTSLSDFMDQLISSEWEQHWESIKQVEPSRIAIFDEAKNCFDSGYYSAAIHIFFSQSDGAFHDKFGKSLYKKEGERARDEMSGYITDFISRDSLQDLIAQYKDASVLRRMFNEVYTRMFSEVAADPMKNIDPSDLENDLVMPNRHGVLHGMHRNYGNKTNALKCFSLFLFVLYAIHGEQMWAHSAFNKRVN
ncbi:hypothetical protein [Pseudoalteromonas ruthenica]|uniref:hypothetical protein n=1 Tax=Pseudoalteromonas ruthenica TaxID=151081 RepID=UPI00110993CA|nr:hypothetical protein [Pseudoalteromonas ruthenica]